MPVGARRRRHSLRQLYTKRYPQLGSLGGGGGAGLWVGWSRPPRSSPSAGRAGAPCGYHALIGQPFEAPESAAGVGLMA